MDQKHIDQTPSNCSHEPEASEDSSENGSATETRQLLPQSRTGSRCKRILVADDNELLRKMVRRILEDQNEFVVCGEAINGRDAVEKATQFRPDLIVLDISMPIMNGFEVIRKITHSLPETPILVLSMHSDPGFINEAAELGALGYVLKTDMSAFIKALKAVADHKSFFPPEDA